MMNIPYLKARYGGNYSNDFLKQTIENSAFAVSGKFKDLCSLYIKLGDIGAIIFGGKPYIDYLIKEKKMSEEEAIKQFILATNRSQQSSAVSSMSNFQIAMNRTPFTRVLMAYKNSPQQYVRMCADAIISTANGDMSKTQCAKYIFQFLFYQPFLFSLATSGSVLRWVLTGDDDDFWADLKTSIFNLGSDAIPIIAEISLYIRNRFIGNNKYMPNTMPLLGDIEYEIAKISKEEPTAKECAEALGYLSLHIGLGQNSKAIVNTASGIGDIATGKEVQGSLKILGMTDHRAKHIIGQD